MATRHDECRHTVLKISRIGYPNLLIGLFINTWIVYACTKCGKEFYARAV